MKHRNGWLTFMAILCVTGSALGSRPAFAAEATITSDELELQHNGDISLFRGHVVLNQDPYEIHADLMTRTKVDSMVNAEGHVVGTWVSAQHEKVRVEGESARYDPNKHNAEVWGKQQVAVHLDGEKGQALFHGDRGWIDTLTPGKARLVGHVTGHVIPAQNS